MANSNPEFTGMFILTREVSRGNGKCRIDVDGILPERSKIIRFSIPSEVLSAVIMGGQCVRITGNVVQEPEDGTAIEEKT